MLKSAPFLRLLVQEVTPLEPGKEIRVTMPEVNLIVVCLIAFASVLTLLSLLAGTISVLTKLFPDTAPEADPTLMQALNEAVSSQFPGARIVKVEEITKK